ncbi:MAG: tail fiber domain-containing protein [Candidatus Saccharibacteria bacterium]
MDQKNKNTDYNYGVRWLSYSLVALAIILCVVVYILWRRTASLNKQYSALPSASSGQELLLSGTRLFITDGNSVDLSSLIKPGAKGANGTSGASKARNGLSVSSSYIELGGTLQRKTTINQSGNDIVFNSVGTGGNIIALGSVGYGAGLDVSGAGTRLVWAPKKAALRAGTVTGSQWDDANIGVGSVAFGQDTIAGGALSLAGGYGSQATGDASIALGANNISSNTGSVSIGFTNTSSGNTSLAFGSGNIASGTRSTAFGDETTSSNDNSTAFGQQTIASGIDSTAFGLKSLASGSYSTAFGFSILPGNLTCTAAGISVPVTTADGYGSTAFGACSNASGPISTAFGFGSVASGDLSTAFGSASVASGSSAIAFGSQTAASGDNSTAFGEGTTAGAANSTALGANINLQATAINSVGINLDSSVAQTVAAANAMVIMGGNVGIGTTAPAGALDVDGTTYLRTTSASVAGDSAVCRNSSGEITVNTSATTCSVSSQRYKHNIEDLGIGIDFVNGMRAVSYQRNSDNAQEIGFIAEEIAALDSRLVFYEADGTTVRGVKYEQMTAVLTKAIQDQSGKLEGINTSLLAQGLRIDSLSAELTALATRLDGLEKNLEDYKTVTDKRIKDLEEKLDPSLIDASVTSP